MKRIVQRVISRDSVTSALEIVGGICICAGAFVLFGTGVALCVAGVALIAGAFLASGGAE